MRKVDDLMAMQPSTSKELPDDTAPSMHLIKKLETSKVQTRSASSSAKRKPASPRKRPTTLHEAEQSSANTGESNRSNCTSSDEPPAKVKSLLSSTTSPASGFRNDCSTELPASTNSTSFPFVCDLATLTGIQALSNLSSATNKNIDASGRFRKPETKLRKKLISPSVPLTNPGLTSMCPDLAKANALISSNAAALAATMNSLMLAGAVNRPDATPQSLSNSDLLATFTALGLMPLVTDATTAQSAEEPNRTKQGIDSALLETAAFAAATGNLGLFGTNLNAISEFIGKTAMQTSPNVQNVESPTTSPIPNAKSALLKGHARRVKQKPITFSTSNIGQEQQKKEREGTATKKLFTSLQNEMPFVSRSSFAKENEEIGDVTKNGVREERIDLEELENFAQTFKKQRIKFGFTQGDVGMALGRRYGTDFSQTTISRFEALNLSFKNMCKLRPLLKEWLADAEAAIASGASVSNLLVASAKNSSTQGTVNGSTIANGAILGGAPQSGSALNSSVVPLRKRRKRTNLDATQRTALDQFFKLNPRPDHDKMAQIAETLELDRDVIRVWFCNRRQKLRKE